MKKKMPYNGIVGNAIGSIVGLSLASPVANAAEGAASNPNMGAGASALARTTPTLYMAGFFKKKLK